MHKHRRNPILLGQDNNALTWLLIINAVVFIAINFIKVIYYISFDTSIEASQNFHLQILDWVSLPADIHAFLTRPWTLLLYMISHISVWSLVGTLLWLWAFGYILQDLAGNSKIIPVYIYGGIAAAAVYLVLWNIVPEYRAGVQNAGPLLGGEAGVVAIAVATTTIAPKYKLFPMIGGGIPLWVLTLLFIAIDYAGIANGNLVVPAAHLAAALVGFVFANQLERGYDWSLWMVNFANWFNDLFNPEKKYYVNPVSQHKYYKATRKPFEKTPRITQQKLDEILDKISQEGFHSLSEEEKDFLKKASQEDI